LPTSVVHRKYDLQAEIIKNINETLDGHSSRKRISPNSLCNELTWHEQFLSQEEVDALLRGITEGMWSPSRVQSRTVPEFASMT
jgi:hypothetical protein